MAKYNWNKLKIAFINGDYKNLKDFSEKKKIPYKTLQESAVGWTREKKEKDRENIGKIENAVRERNIEREITRILSRNDRVLEAHDKLLEVYERLGVEDIIELAKEQPKAFVSLTSGLVNIQKVHRLAEGLDKENGGDGESNERPVVNVIFKDLSLKGEDDGK